MTVGIGDLRSRSWTRPNQMLGHSFRVRRMLDGDAAGMWASVAEAERLDRGGVEPCDPDLTTPSIVALKVARPVVGRANAELMADVFGLEASFLALLGQRAAARPAPSGSVSLLGLGFLRPSSAHYADAANTLQWTALGPPRPDVVKEFVDECRGRILTGEVPVLILEPLDVSRSLRRIGGSLDNGTGRERHQVLPLWVVLPVVLRALEVLEEFERLGFFYVDHKLEHIIWTDGDIRFLDFNGGTWLDAPPGVPRFGAASRDAVGLEEPDAYESAADLRLTSTAQDLWRFTTNVFYPLLTGTSIDGQHPVGSIIGNTSSVNAETVAGGLLEFRFATAFLDEELRALMSRANPRPPRDASAPVPFSSAHEYRAALADYFERWTERHAVALGLARRWAEHILKAQAVYAAQLRQAVAGLEDLGQDDSASEPGFALEAARLAGTLERLLDRPYHWQMLNQVLATADVIPKPLASAYAAPPSRSDPPTSGNQFRAGTAGISLTNDPDLKTIDGSTTDEMSDDDLVAITDEDLKRQPRWLRAKVYRARAALRKPPTPT
jgi:hypothetical protein